MILHVLDREDAKCIADLETASLCKKLHNIITTALRSLTPHAGQRSLINSRGIVTHNTELFLNISKDLHKYGCIQGGAGLFPLS